MVSRQYRETGSRDLDLDLGHFSGGQRFSVLSDALEVALNGVPDVRQRLVARFALAEATGQRGALGDDESAFVAFEPTYWSIGAGPQERIKAG